MSLIKQKLVPKANEKITHTIIRYLVDLIKSGELKAGDKLPPERELTLQLGVSRASLREALSSLSVIGVLETGRGAGTVIGNFNLSTFVDIVAPLLIRNDQMEKELLDFRRMLETDALRLSFENDLLDTTFLHQQLEVMNKALTCGDMELSVQADIAFHRHLFIMSNNYILKEVYTYVRLLMEKSVYFNVSKIFEKGDNAFVLYEQHKALCSFIEKRQLENAVSLLSEHINFVNAV